MKIDKATICYILAIIFGGSFLLSPCKQLVSDLIYIHHHAWWVDNNDIIGPIVVAVEIIIVVLLVLWGRYFDRQYFKKKKEEEKLELAKAETEKENLKARYDASVRNLEIDNGKLTNKISLKECDLNQDIIVFKESEKIWLLGEVYSFKDILGYNLSDNQQLKKGDIEFRTKASTADMLGRSFWGKFLAGDVGAAVGATTGEKATIAVQQNDVVLHDYFITINIDSLEKPTIRIAIGDNEALANEIAGLINVIVKRNAVS